MAADTWAVAGTGLPDGDPVQLWVRAGTLSTEPVPDAPTLPGRFVLAGLVDAHAHLTIELGADGPGPAPDQAVADRLAAARSSGVLALRDVGSPDRRTLTLRPGADDPVVQVAGRFLAPADGYFPRLHQPVPAAGLVEAALAELRAGASWVKLVGDWQHGANYDPAVVRDLVAAVHAAGGRVAVHTTTDAACVLVSLGVDSVEHGHELDEDAVRAMAERGTAWTPTAAASLGWPPPADQSWPLLDRWRQLVPLAVRLGVPVLTGTDGVGTVAQEVAWLARLGVDPADALAAATTVPRRVLHLAGLAGSAPADLVTYDQDPRADPLVLEHPTAVLRRGRRIR